MWAGAHQVKLHIVTANLPLTSVSLVLSLPVGARDEPAGLSGITHVLEHLLPSASQDRGLSFEEWVETIGGESNAETDSESVCLWARVPASHGPDAARRLLACLDSAPQDADALNRERAVIRHELADLRNDHLERAIEQLLARMFPRHPLGRPVGGTQAALSRIDLQGIVTYWERVVTKSTAVLAIVGDPDTTGRTIEACPSQSNDVVSRPHRAPPSDMIDPHREPRVPKVPHRGFVAMGGIGVPMYDDRQPAYEVLAELFGRSPLSLLFKHLRSRMQLSYDVSSWHQAFSDSGVWCIAVACARADSSEIAQIVLQTLESVRDQSVPPLEINAAARRLAGRFALSVDDPFTRADVLTEAAFCAYEGDPIRTRERSFHRTGPEDVALAAKLVIDSLTFSFR